MVNVIPGSMSPSLPVESQGPFVGVLYGELLAQGIRYFLPASILTRIGNVEPIRPVLTSHLTRPDQMQLEWLGGRYTLDSGGRVFTDNETKLLRSIGKVLSMRYDLLFNAESAALSSHVFRGLPEDRYVSAFLEPRRVEVAGRQAGVIDRISEAIEVLRISSLSTYENRRISTGVLLFGSQPDPCHALPDLPAGALPYSTGLTSIRSFHRIGDGLRTIALVNQDGLMVELIDVQEWAQPYGNAELPVPSARRYEIHNRATLCGGHICLILTPNGEIKIFAEGVQVFSFVDGRWRLSDVAEKYRLWTEALREEHLARRLFTVALNLSELRRGGLFVVLHDPEMVRELVSSRDLLTHQNGVESPRSGSKDQLHYLLRSRRVTEMSPLVLETVARIDGSIVLDRNANLLSFGAILRHNRLMDVEEEVSEGGRTTAAIMASEFGSVLKVSEDGQISFYQGGRCIWDL